MIPERAYQDWDAVPCSRGGYFIKALTRLPLPVVESFLLSERGATRESSHDLVASRIEAFMAPWEIGDSPGDSLQALGMRVFREGGSVGFWFHEGGTTVLSPTPRCGSGF